MKAITWPTRPGLQFWSKYGLVEEQGDDFALPRHKRGLKYVLVQPAGDQTNPYTCHKPFFLPRMRFLERQILNANIASECKSECKFKFALSANLALDANLTANSRTFSLKNLHPVWPIFFFRIFWHQNQVLQQNTDHHRIARFLDCSKMPSNFLHVKIKAP